MATKAQRKRSNEHIDALLQRLDRARRKKHNSDKKYDAEIGICTVQIREELGNQAKEARK